MDTVSITIDINPAHLTTATDQTLATYWHVAQANPADGFETSTPGELVEKIGREIIRRWLSQVPAELYHHQGRHYHWHQLTKFAKYQPGDPDWAAGQWLPKPTQDTAAESPF